MFQQLGPAAGSQVSTRPPEPELLLGERGRCLGSRRTLQYQRRVPSPAGSDSFPGQASVGVGAGRVGREWSEEAWGEGSSNSTSTGEHLVDMGPRHRPRSRGGSPRHKGRWAAGRAGMRTFPPGNRALGGLPPLNATRLSPRRPRTRSSVPGAAPGPQWRQQRPPLPSACAQPRSSPGVVGRRRARAEGSSPQLPPCQVTVSWSEPPPQAQLLSASPLHSYAPRLPSLQAD